MPAPIDLPAAPKPEPPHYLVYRRGVAEPLVVPVGSALGRELRSKLDRGWPDGIVRSPDLFFFDYRSVDAVVRVD